MNRKSSRTINSTARFLSPADFSLCRLSVHNYPTTLRLAAKQLFTITYAALAKKRTLNAPVKPDSMLWTDSLQFGTKTP
jgi:hypothetical protein